MKRLIAISVTALTVFLLASAVSAAAPWPAECVEGSLPGNDPRYPSDQLILTCVPANWNGSLVVYAHGYVPVQLPLFLPAGELTLSDGRTIPEVLLSLGYAFATSSYHKNGYAVEQAGRDLNALVDYFRDTVATGPVHHVFITGASEGGVITVMLLEQHPERYSAGLALCGPIGGMPYQIKYLGDFRVIFDYFFPAVFPFGAMDIPPYAYLDWDTFYVPAIVGAVQSDPSSTDQLFKVTRAARDPGDPTSAATTALSDLFYSIWATNDAIQTAGGEPYGNLFTRYRGSVNDYALNVGVERVRPDATAQAYIRSFYQTSGKLDRPLVTLHTTLDGLVPFEHELRYLGLALLSGRIANLTVLPVRRYGHCAFTTEEILGAFAVMVLRSGGSLTEDLERYLSTSSVLGGTAGGAPQDLFR